MNVKAILSSLYEHRFFLLFDISFHIFLDVTESNIIPNNYKTVNKYTSNKMNKDILEL